MSGEVDPTCLSTTVKEMYSYFLSLCTEAESQTSKVKKKKEKKNPCFKSRTNSMKTNAAG